MMDTDVVPLYVQSKSGLSISSSSMALKALAQVSFHSSSISADESGLCFPSEEFVLLLSMKSLPASSLACRRELRSRSIKGGSWSLTSLLII